MLASLDLTGRVAVAVGCTSGLGRVIALGLADAGADVVPTGRRADLVKEVCAEVEKRGRKTLAQPVDVSERASLDELRDKVLEKFGRIDILLNAAGRTGRKPTRNLSEDEWNAILDTNLTGTLRSCQAFYEPLAANGRGRIINICSLSSFVGLN